MSAGHVILTRGLTTATMLALVPAAGLATREHVVVEWMHHGERPSTPDWGVLRGSPTTIVVSPGNIAQSRPATHPVQEPEEDGGEVIMRRIDALARLQAGWVGAGSLSPDPEVLSWLNSHRQLLANSGHPVSLVPIEDGSVAITWASASREYRAEVRAGQMLYTFVDYLDSDDYEEELGALSDERLRAFLDSASSA